MKNAITLLKTATILRVLAGNRASHESREQTKALNLCAAIGMLTVVNALPCHAHDAVKEIENGTVTRAFYVNKKGSFQFEEALSGSAVERNVTPGQKKSIRNGIVTDVLYATPAKEIDFVEKPKKSKPLERNLTGHLHWSGPDPCLPPCRIKVIMGVQTCLCK